MPLNPFSEEAKKNRAAARREREARRRREAAARKAYESALRAIDITDLELDVTQHVEMERRSASSELKNWARQSIDRQVADDWLEELLLGHCVSPEHVWRATAVIALFDLEMDDRRYTWYVMGCLSAGLWPEPRYVPSLLPRRQEITLLAEPVIWPEFDDFADQELSLNCRLEVTTGQVAVLGHPDGDIFIDITELRAVEILNDDLLRLATYQGEQLVLRTPLAVPIRASLAEVVRRAG